MRAGAGGAPRFNYVTNVQFAAQLVVAAEPRLTLSQGGAPQVQVLEATDDRGNSLIAGADGPTVSNRVAGYFGMMNGPVLHLQLQLHRPASAGDTIKKLRGVIPLSVSSRRPDPIVVPLAGAAGKTFQNSELQLTVHDIRTMPNTPNTLIELSLKANDRHAPAEVAEVERFTAGLQRFDPHHLQIEVIDARGQSIPWFQSVVDAETARVTLTVTNLPQAGQPKELRYYGLTRAAVNIPFEFTDIPMP
jgi:hypothetical protein